MKIFEEATRTKLRFPTALGNLTVEDIWDLPLITTTGAGVDLDIVARSTNKLLIQSEEESFVAPKTVQNATLRLKLDILLHIINIKLEEKAAREHKVENKLKKERILTAIAEKEDSALQGKSINNLKKMLDELD